MRRPVSASERKGIMAVAIVALAVTLAGIVFRQCSRPSASLSPADVSVILSADSVDSASGREVSDGENKERRRKSYRKNGKESKGSGRSPKNYRRRSPIDEPV